MDFCTEQTGAVEEGRKEEDRVVGYHFCKELIERGLVSR